ncbi:MAG: zinc ribbon-containing protein [Halothiobacillaceae bacterium]
MTDHDKHPLTDAYYHMLERVYERLLADETRDPAAPKFEEAVSEARRHAIAQGELDREQAVKVGDYLKRDVEDFAMMMLESADRARARIEQDLSELERELLGKLLKIADQTTVELNAIREQARQRPPHDWQAGEITSAGMLECRHCGHANRHPRTGPITRCPHCDGRHFRRGKSVH